MKLKCYVCDICGKQMDGRDFQYWIRRPRIKCGYPNVEMDNFDLCSRCFRTLIYKIQEQIRKENPDVIKYD